MKPYPLYSYQKLDTLREVVDWCSGLYGHQSAFVWRTGKTIQNRDYSEFRADVIHLCSFLKKIHGKNGHVSILGENSYIWIVAYIASAYGGLVSVPLDKDMPPKEVEEKLTASDSDVLVLSDTYADYSEAVGKLGIQIVLFSEIETFLADSAGKEIENVLDPLSGETLASIVFTSGTTGKSKGVMLTQKNLTSDIHAAACNVSLLGSGILVLPLHHTFGSTAALLAAMYTGRSIFINRSLRTIAADLKTAAPTHLFAVPLLVETLYKNIWNTARKTGKENALHRLISISEMLRKVKIDLRRILFRRIINELGGNLKLIVSGGAPLSDKLVRGFDQLGIIVLNGYGITECSPIVAVNRNHFNIVGSVGLPLICNEVKIAADGEVLVRGENVMKGYYRNEIETAECIRDGWLYTGDLGRIDQNGALHIIGRKKNLIILSNGENIAAEEIEELILEKIGYVAEVIVTGSSEGIQAECYLAPNQMDLSSRIDQDIAALNKQLPPSKRVTKVLLRDTEFPKTTTKKIKRGEY